MILLKGGEIISPKESFLGDLLIEGERIRKVFRAEETEAEKDFLASLPLPAEVVDAQGLLLFPGFIDAHTHFDLHVAGTVTCDDFASGTRSAIAGGTTTIVDFGTQYPGETLEEGYRNWQKKADVGSSCDYSFHMSLTDWNETAKKDCQRMMEEGLSTFKIYMTYDTKVEDDEILSILKRLREVHGITGCHCENHGIIKELQEEYIADPIKKGSVSSHPLTRPAEAEAEAISRYLRIAEVADAPVIDVHLTCEEGLREIRTARERGQTVYAETCPHYLLLTEDVYRKPWDEAARYVCSPPLRKSSDQEALWKGLAQGEIQTVSTDHCAFTTEQKRLGQEDFRKIPGGMPGVETRGILMYSEGITKGRLSKERFAAVMSENPARLYGMYPKKGALREGADADIVLIDPKARGVISAETQHSACDYTPYEGKKVDGAIKAVFLRGEKVVENNIILSENRGKFVVRGEFQDVK